MAMSCRQPSDKIIVTPPFTPAQIEYLRRFASIRHVTRDAAQLAKLPDPIRDAVGLPVGPDGAFTVAGGDAFRGGSAVVDSNRPPDGQPTTWCTWEVTPDGGELQWAEEGGGAPDEWLNYLQRRFFKDWGRRLSGEKRFPNADGRTVVLTIDWSGTARFSGIE